MAMLDAQGIPYDHGLIDEIWNRLLRCQTHSSATLTDETNDYIQQETQNAYNLITSNTIYLMKLLSLSLQRTEEGYPLLVCNTLPIQEHRPYIQPYRQVSLTSEFYRMEKNCRIHI